MTLKDLVDSLVRKILFVDEYRTRKEGLQGMSKRLVAKRADYLSRGGTWEESRWKKNYMRVLRKDFHPSSELEQKIEDGSITELSVDATEYSFSEFLDDKISAAAGRIPFIRERRQRQDQFDSFRQKAHDAWISYIGRGGQWDADRWTANYIRVNSSNISLLSEDDLDIIRREIVDDEILLRQAAASPVPVIVAMPDPVPRKIPVWQRVARAAPVALAAAYYLKDDPLPGALMLAGSFAASYAVQYIGKQVAARVGEEYAGGALGASASAMRFLQGDPVGGLGNAAYAGLATAAGISHKRGEYERARSLGRASSLVAAVTGLWTAATYMFRPGMFDLPEPQVIVPGIPDLDDIPHFELPEPYGPPAPEIYVEPIPGFELPAPYGPPLPDDYVFPPAEIQELPTYPEAPPQLPEDPIYVPPELPLPDAEEPFFMIPPGIPDSQFIPDDCIPYVPSGA